MRRLLLVTLAVLLWALPCVAQDKAYRVSVTQIVEHPSLDAMRLGFLDRLMALGIKVEPMVHIAQGNMGTNVQIASQIQG